VRHCEKTLMAERNVAHYPTLTAPEATSEYSGAYKRGGMSAAQTLLAATRPPTSRRSGTWRL
jgi:hypothetical protein